MKYYVLKCTVNYNDLLEENYGVMISNDDHREYICDVSDNYDDILTFVDELNNHHVDYCHVDSIVEDYKYKKRICKHKNV